MWGEQKRISPVINGRRMNQWPIERERVCVIAEPCVALAECRVCYVMYTFETGALERSGCVLIAASHLFHPARPPPHLIHSLVYCRGGIWVRERGRRMCSRADRKKLAAIKNALCYYGLRLHLVQTDSDWEWAVFNELRVAVHPPSCFDKLPRGSKIYYFQQRHQQDADDLV